MRIQPSSPMLLESFNVTEMAPICKPSSKEVNRFVASVNFCGKETQRNERAGDFCKKVAASDMMLAATCQEAIKIFLQFLMGDLNPIL